MARTIAKKPRPARRGKGPGRVAINQATAAGEAAVFNRGKGETLAAVLARCPHQGGELREAWLTGARRQGRALRWPGDDDPGFQVKLKERQL